MDNLIDQRFLSAQSEVPVREVHRRRALNVEPRCCLGVFSFRNKKSSRGERAVKKFMEHHHGRAPNPTGFVPLYVVAYIQRMHPTRH
jgi:hypothetical protein